MDGFTVLVIFMIFCCFICIGWICNSIFFKLASRSSQLWACTNFFLVGHVLLYTWRGTGPDLLTYHLNDFLLLIAAICLRGGVEAFIGKKIIRLDYVLTFLFAETAMIVARLQPNYGQATAVAIMSAFWCYHLSQTGFGGYTFMRKEFSFKASFVTNFPVIILALIFFGRMVAALVSEDDSAGVANLTGGFNAAFYLSTLICAIAFNTSAAGLSISRLISTIRKLSIEDSLTKIANRRHIENLIEKELEMSRREQKTFSIVMLDVDHFKSVNDKYGHAAGDAALKLCASVLKRSVRGSDHVGRFGGEEFCALLPNTDQDGAITAAERMRSLLEKEVLIWDGMKIPLTASFGVVTFKNDDSITSSDLFKRVDSAMYRAKHEGRNRVIIDMAS